MPRRNIYVPQEDIEYFEKAQRYAGDSLSALVVKWIKDFVRQRELQFKALEELEIIKGKTNQSGVVIAGKKYKIAAMEIASNLVIRPDGKYVKEKLYVTAKGQYVFYRWKNTEDVKMIDHDFFTFGTLKDAKKVVPGIMIDQAEKKLAEQQEGEFLDI